MHMPHHDCLIFIDCMKINNTQIIMYKILSCDREMTAKAIINAVKTPIIKRQSNTPRYHYLWNAVAATIADLSLLDMYFS